MFLLTKSCAEIFAHDKSVTCCYLDCLVVYTSTFLFAHEINVYTSKKFQTFNCVTFLFTPYVDHCSPILYLSITTKNNNTEYYEADND